MVSAETVNLTDVLGDRKANIENEALDARAPAGAV